MKIRITATFAAMRITIAAATRPELKEAIIRQAGKHTMEMLYTGVGILASAVSLTQHALQQQPDLIIQAGIAGGFYNGRALGEVVAVRRECIGDLGVIENKIWTDLFFLDLVDPNETPYETRYLPNECIDKYNVLHLPTLRGVTVNQISTDEKVIERMQTDYYADVESMEGASLHYVCRLLNIPFIQLRAISNYVGERDKSKWKIKEAVDNLNDVLVKMVNGDL